MPAPTSTNKWQCGKQFRNELYYTSHVFVFRRTLYSKKCHSNNCTVGVRFAQNTQKFSKFLHQYTLSQICYSPTMLLQYLVKNKYLKTNCLVVLPQCTVHYICSCLTWQINWLIDWYLQTGKRCTSKLMHRKSLSNYWKRGSICPPVFFTAASRRSFHSWMPLFINVCDSLFHSASRA